MAQRTVAPYGSWPSPISIEMAVAGAVTLREPRLDGGDIYWIEGRPAEKGRQVIVRRSVATDAEDVTPAEMNARTMAHEYGGGVYAVAGGEVFFSNLPDGRIYRQRVGSMTAEPLTPEGPYRYADIVVDAAHGRLIAVREDHRPTLTATGEGADARPGADGRGAEPENTLVAIALDDVAAGAPVGVLVAGHDFYSTPRPSPDGQRLAWLAWRHPNMPWDGTELWVADIARDGTPGQPRLVAGGPDESIVQPEWAADGALVYVSDRTGWWNLYRQYEGSDGVPLFPAEAEFAGPQWVFGMSWFGIAPDGSIVAVARRAGRSELWLVPTSGQPERIAVPDEEIAAVRVGSRQVLYLGASSTQPLAVVLLDLAGGERRVLQQARHADVGPDDISRPEAITFPTADGRSAHALFYPPTNRDHQGPPDERPPLVVMSHGGPTAHAFGGLDLEKQLFTSRGIAVVDVDYGGSTGYGRDYRRRLDGKWGIVDVEDCINAARYLARRGDVDEDRMAIRGGSAGGYTTLCALVFHDVFAAGASHFGVGDLEALARDTHKFESRYLDRLVAPYPTGIETYRQRSPIHFAERCTCPVIVLQGLDDKVVPPAQAEELVAALHRRGIPHAYLPFAGEGHGFRQRDNIRRALEAELSFYAQVFGFRLADEVEPVVLR
jgi:dipeptidyl aminopeptidase/acylaminoacyl peptidase